MNILLLFTDSDHILIIKIHKRSNVHFSHHKSTPNLISYAYIAPIPLPRINITKETSSII